MVINCYYQAENPLPILRRWEVMLLSQKTGQITQSIVADVTTHRFNEVIDPSEFQLEFPAGTEVVNFKQTRSMWYLSLPVRKRPATCHESSSHQDRSLLY